VCTELCRLYMDVLRWQGVSMCVWTGCGTKSGCAADVWHAGEVLHYKWVTPWTMVACAGLHHQWVQPRLHALSYAIPIC
jgi:hypothetical protein